MLKNHVPSALRSPPLGIPSVIYHAYINSTKKYGLPSYCYRNLLYQKRCCFINNKSFKMWCIDHASLVLPNFIWLVGSFRQLTDCSSWSALHSSGNPPFFYGVLTTWCYQTNFGPCSSLLCWYIFEPVKVILGRFDMLAKGSQSTQH